MTHNYSDWNISKFGKIRRDVKASSISWFNSGGVISTLFYPQSTEALCNFFQEYNSLDSKPKIVILGATSNLLISDNGFDGIAIKLGKGFNDMQVCHETSTITAGAAVLDKNIALFAMENNLSSLEFLSGIPGGVGGALKMNSGCFDSEIKDVLLRCEAVTFKGNKIKISKDEMQFEYRKCNLATETKMIFTSATFQCISRDGEQVKATMNNIQERREGAQPITKGTAGSTFKNPQNTTKKAWQLIREAKMDTARVGGAFVSPKHSNFIINRDGTSEDIATLIKNIAHEVKKITGIQLEKEIEFIGINNNLTEE